MCAKFLISSRSIILYIACILSFVWRAGTTNHERTFVLSPRAELGIRIAFSAVFGLGVVYFALVIKTFWQYGDALDKSFKAKVDLWAKERMSDKASYRSRHTPPTLWTPPLGLAWDLPSGPHYPPFGQAWGPHYPPFGQAWGPTHYPPFGQAWGPHYPPFGQAWGPHYPPFGQAWGTPYPPFGQAWDTPYPPFDTPYPPFGQAWGTPYPTFGQGWGTPSGPPYPSFGEGWGQPSDPPTPRLYRASTGEDTLFPSYTPNRATLPASSMYSDMPPGVLPDLEPFSPQKIMDLRFQSQDGNEMPQSLQSRFRQTSWWKFIEVPRYTCPKPHDAEWISLGSCGCVDW